MNMPTDNFVSKHITVLKKEIAKNWTNTQDSLRRLLFLRFLLKSQNEPWKKPWWALFPVGKEHTWAKDNAIILGRLVSFAIQGTNRPWSTISATSQSSFNVHKSYRKLGWQLLVLKNSDPTITNRIMSWTAFDISITGILFTASACLLYICVVVFAHVM